MKLLKELRDRGSYISEFIILVLAYFVTAKVGLAIDPVGGFATLVWPPTGIALAAILISGYRLLPAIFIAALLANFTQGAPPLVALGIAIGNTLEAFAGAYLLKKINFRNSLERVVDVISLILFAAVLSTTLSASIGTLSLLLGKVIPFINFPQTWFAWWIGDMLGNLIFAPLLLVWIGKLKVRFTIARILEVLFVSLILLLIILLAFSNILREGNHPPLSYLVFLPLIWFSLRFGQREVTFSNFIVSILSIIFTYLGMGPFATEKLSSGLIYLQFYMGVISSTSLLTAVVVTERNLLEQRKDEFISLASHELKTPLTVIQGFNQLLLKELAKYKEAKIKSYILHINQQINRLTKLVNNLLDMSKIQSGKLELNKESFSLKQLLTETLSDIKSISKNHKIILNYISSKENVLADRDSIHQVLLNLINNAIKYSPAKSKIIIRVNRDAKNITVSVKDFGVGIPQIFQDKIFDRFYRIMNEDNKHISGLGLGLYLSANIIKAHNGKIWFRSKEGRGSTLYFTLPLGK